MKKFSFIINFIPLLAWLLWFVGAACDVSWMIEYQFFILLVLPPIFSVLNFLLSKEQNSFLKRNGMFALFDLIGQFISGALYMSFISNDPETPPVINTFAVFSVIYIMVLTLAGYLIKMLITKNKML
ncbi:MAG: hypothetical protein IJA44_05715 [Clostridia bacterium]|nr:hypothetical protein [Clostridia bacterium]